MLPPIPNFSVVENTSRKRKKPERDFIEEMLQSENSQKEGDYQEKRAKKEDNDDGSISMMKPSLINDNTKHDLGTCLYSYDSNKNPELYKKSGGLIVNIHQVLDKGSFDLFRQTMKKISSKSWDNPDSIINNILTSFFNATIGIVDPKSKVIPNEIPMYKERKKLSTELVKYISRDLRPRYKQIFSNFYDKYEDNYFKGGYSFDFSIGLI